MNRFVLSVFGVALGLLAIADLLSFFPHALPEVSTVRAGQWIDGYFVNGQIRVMWTTFRGHSLFDVEIPGVRVGHLIFTRTTGDPGMTRRFINVSALLVIVLLVALLALYMLGVRWHRRRRLAVRGFALRRLENARTIAHQMRASPD